MAYSNDTIPNDDTTPYTHTIDPLDSTRNLKETPSTNSKQGPLRTKTALWHTCYILGYVPCEASRT